MLDRTTIDPPLAGAALANVANSLWTGERVDMLRSMHADGRSAGWMAVELGMTRNAVIGKVHRLHLERRGPPNKPGRPRAQTRPNMTSLLNRKAEAMQPRAAKVAPMPVEVPIASAPCSLLELTDDTCRWPIGDPREPDFAFCGGMARNGAPYCAGHMRIAYQAPASRHDRRSIPV